MTVARSLLPGAVKPPRDSVRGGVANAKSAIIDSVGLQWCPSREVGRDLGDQRLAGQADKVEAKGVRIPTEAGNKGQRGSEANRIVAKIRDIQIIRGIQGDRVR